MTLVIASRIIPSEEHVVTSRSIISRPCCESHAKVHSTTQRRGTSSKPWALSLRLTISSSIRRRLGISNTHSTSLPAYPASAQNLRIQPCSAGRHATTRTPSRSWTEAEWTTAASTNPSVSTSRCRLILTIFIPSSYPRKPGRPAERTLCESMIAAAGAFSYHRSSGRSRSAGRAAFARPPRPSTSRSSGNRSSRAAGPWASSARRCGRGPDRKCRRRRGSSCIVAAGRASRGPVSAAPIRSIRCLSGRLSSGHFSSAPHDGGSFGECASKLRKDVKKPLLRQRSELLDSLLDR